MVDLEVNLLATGHPGGDLLAHEGNVSKRRLLTIDGVALSVDRRTALKMTFERSEVDLPRLDRIPQIT